VRRRRAPAPAPRPLQAVAAAPPRCAAPGLRRPPHAAARGCGPAAARLQRGGTAGAPPRRPVPPQAAPPRPAPVAPRRTAPRPAPPPPRPLPRTAPLRAPPRAPPRAPYNPPRAAPRRPHHHHPHTAMAPPAAAAGAAPAAYASVAGASDTEFTPLGVLRHVLGLPGPSGFGSRSTADDVLARWDGRGKVAIVTGASGGIGAETARALAARGCHVGARARRGATRARGASEARGCGSRRGACGARGPPGPVPCPSDAPTTDEPTPSLAPPPTAPPPTPSLSPGVPRREEDAACSLGHRRRPPRSARRGDAARPRVARVGARLCRGVHARARAARHPGLQRCGVGEGVLQALAEGASIPGDPPKLTPLPAAPLPAPPQPAPCSRRCRCLPTASRARLPPTTWATGCWCGA
jgi:hypothetical protein